MMTWRTDDLPTTEEEFVALVDDPEIDVQGNFYTLFEQALAIEEAEEEEEE